MDRSLRAVKIVASGSAASSVYKRGRRCSEEGCDTVLSMYNPSAYCAIHLRAERQSRGKRETERELLTKTCGSQACGLTFETTNPARRFCSDRCRMLAFAERQRELAI